MEAVEFIKKYGIDEAKKVLVYCEEQGIGLCVGSKTVSISELKRFVESYDLVEFYGGIECSKSLSYGNIIPNKVIDEIKQAVEDMEKLYEKEH